MPNHGGRYEIRGGKRVRVDQTEARPSTRPKAEKKPAEKPAPKQTRKNVKEADNG